MRLEDAEAAEREGLLEKAADLYEEAIAEGSASLCTFLNLIVLYWQVTDFGFRAGMNLPLAFVKRAGERFRELLSLARARFPGSTEVVFWSRYIDWADLGTPLSTSECEDLLAANPADLTPALFLYSHSEGHRFQAEAMRLLDAYRGRGTLRAGYIVSVIEAGLMHSRRGDSRNRETGGHS